MFFSSLVNPLSLSWLMMLIQTLSTLGQCELTYCSITYTGGNTVVHCVSAEPVERTGRSRLFVCAEEWGVGLNRIWVCPWNIWCSPPRCLFLLCLGAGEKFQRFSLSTVKVHRWWKLKMSWRKGAGVFLFSLTAPHRHSLLHVVTLCWPSSVCAACCCSQPLYTAT